MSKSENWTSIAIETTKPILFSKEANFDKLSENAISEIFFSGHLREKATCYLVAFVQRTILSFSVNRLFPPFSS